ncbi:MAG: MFS transporter [Ilumatobacteraceae bacterium]
MTIRQRVVAALVIGAVGLAFADASVVALALPDLYAEFDTSIVGVSWVLTTYALVVAIVAVPVAVLHDRVRPLSLVVAGIAVFSAASLVAGFANSLALLLVARCAQGVGATLLLAGSLPVLGMVAGERARRWWAMAGAVGAAIGPALGGVLTQLFDWRAIFFVQAPIVAAALVVATDPLARAMRREGHVHGAAGTRRRDVIVANIGFALVFAALVGALFLGVLLAIEVWRYSPIASAVLVSALPLGMAVGRSMKRAPRVVVAVGGSLPLALGLVGLALLPGEQPVMAAIAFALCGAGFDLVHEVLDAAAVPSDGPAVRASAVSIGARHAGLVVGLVLIAPVLSSSLEAGIGRATLSATSTMLETELPLSDKLPVTWALRTAIEDAPRGQVPDLAGEFDERGAEGDNAMARARDSLMDAVTDAVTRSFRPAFLVAAGLAALAAVPALLVALGASRTVEATGTSRTLSTVGIGLLGVAAFALFGAQFAAGAAGVGEYAAADPCTAPPDTYPGGGIDGAVQEIALSALNGAACELGTTRERLVLSIDPESGYGDVTWDDATAEEALRVGAHRAIDDANDRDSIPGWVAAIMGFAADRAPIGWLVERLPIPG